MRPARNRVRAITDTAARLARLYTVSGRVQGVWFRDSTRKQAQTLLITGYARNLADGNVEVLACGSEASLGALKRWLKKGPPLAKVSQVLETDAELQKLDSFTIS